MAKPKIKYELMNLDKLMESASAAEAIGATTKDDSTYNVVTKQSSLMESVDSDEFSKELGAILENSKDISPKYSKIDSALDVLETEVNGLFGLLEAAVAPDMTSNLDLEQLKNKKVLMRNGKGAEMPAIVVNVSKDTVTLKGSNGGLVNISKDGFRKVFVKVLEEAAAPVKAPAPAQAAAPQPKPAMESVAKPCVCGKCENCMKNMPKGKNIAKEPIMENSVDIKESSPVKDEPKVQENPSGKLTEPGKIDFSKLPAVEHDTFVKDALAAKNGMTKDAEHNMAPKFKPAVEIKLLKHSDKYRTFVESFKDGSNDPLVECILEAWDAYVSHIKTKAEVK